MLTNCNHTVPNVQSNTIINKLIILLLTNYNHTVPNVITNCNHTVPNVQSNIIKYSYIMASFFYCYEVYVSAVNREYYPLNLSY